MELRRYLAIFRRRLWFILATLLLTTSVGYAVTEEPPQYLARTTIYVGSRTISLEPGANELSGDRAAALDRLVLTFSKMIDSEPIAQRTVVQLDLDRSPREVVEATSVKPEPATQLLYIDVTDIDPAVAQSLANGLAEAFVEAVQEFEPGDTEGAVPRLPAYVFERAGLPTAPVPTNQLQSVVLAALFGLLAASGLAILLDYLDLTIRSAADAERRLELPVLGVIPLLDGYLPPERLNPTPAAGR